MGSKPTVMRSFEEYCADVAAAVAERLLKNILKDPPWEEGLPKDADPFHIDLYAESDGRLKNKVYQMLQDKGVLVSFVKVDVTYSNNYNFYRSSSKRIYNWEGTVNKEWFDKNAPGLAVEPVFEIMTMIKDPESHYFSENKILAKEDDSYKQLSDLKDTEILWIYYHLSDYDIKNFGKEWHNSKTGTHRTYHKKFFPKKLLADSSVTLYLAHADEYLKKHIEWGVQHTLGIKGDIVINKLKLGTCPDFMFEGAKKKTTENVDDQIGRVKNHLILLKEAQKSLIRFRDAVEKFGGWKVFEEKNRENFLAYLQDSYPLHLGENEPDEELRKLCEMVVLGKDKGINPRIQELELSTIKQEA